MENYEMISANASLFKPIGVFKEGTVFYSAFGYADTDEQILEFTNLVWKASNNGIIGFRTCNILGAQLSDFTGKYFTPNHTFIVDRIIPTTLVSSALSLIKLAETLGSGTTAPTLTTKSYADHTYIVLRNPT